MNRNIKKIVSYYKRKTGTSNPFAIADQLGILYQICDLQFEGCYMFLKNHRYIFINQNLPEHEQRLVMAHELVCSCKSCHKKETVAIDHILDYQTAHTDDDILKYNRNTKLHQTGIHSCGRHKICSGQMNNINSA